MISNTPPPGDAVDWDSVLQATVVSKLQEWKSIRDPDSGDPYFASIDDSGTEEDHTIEVRFIPNGGLGDAAGTCGIMGIITTYNTGDTGDSANGAGLLLHEFGHAIGIVPEHHAGIGASSSSTSTVNAMTTCYELGFSAASDASVGRDDSVEFVNTQWERPYGSPIGSSPFQAMDANPGFVDGLSNWKESGGIGTTFSSGGADNGAYVHWSPTGTGGALISSEITVVPAGTPPDEAWVAIEAENRVHAETIPTTKLRKTTSIRRLKYPSTAPLVLAPELVDAWPTCASQFASDYVEHEVFADLDDIVLSDSTLDEGGYPDFEWQGAYPTYVGLGNTETGWRAFHVVAMLGTDNQIVPDDPEDPDCQGEWWWNPEECPYSTVPGAAIDIDNVMVHVAPDWSLG